MLTHLLAQAFRLTDQFMAAYKKNSYVAGNGAVLPSSKVFEELPVKVKNSFLVTALLRELEDSRDEADTDFSAVDEHTGNTYAEKSIEMMSQCVDDLADETRKLSDFERSQQRGKDRRGHDAPEPSRLDTMLIANQMSNLCTQVSQFAGQASSRMFLAQGVSGSQ